MSADHPNSTDILPPTGGTPPPPQTAGGPQVVDLGNGYSIVYPDPANPYDYQIVSNKTAAATGDGGVSATSYYTQQQQNARDAAQLAQQNNQWLEQFGMDKARGDQQMQLQQELGRGNLAVSQGRLGLDTQQQLNDWYNKQAERYSNPRNFIESFFFQRGQPAPQGAANSAIGRPLGQFYGGQAPQPAPAQQSAPATQPYQRTPAQQQTANASGSTGYADPSQGLSGFNSDGTYRLAASDPDAQRLMAAHPGQYRIGFAQGGVTPEPIMGRGMVSGQTYMIGEKGPEGVVPTQYLPRFLQQRHGQMMGQMRPMMGGQTHGYAVGGTLGYDTGTTTTDPLNYNPYAGDPYTTPDPTFPDPYQAPTPAPYYDPTGNVLTQGSTDMGGATTPLAPASNTYDFTQNAAPAGFHWQNGVLVQDTSTNTVVPQTQTQTGTTTPTTDPYGGPYGRTGNGGDLFMPTNPGEAPIIPGSYNPGYVLGLPQSSNNFNSGVTTANIPGASPAASSPAGTFGAPSGNRPQFLPGEDNGGTALSALLSANALPPFLSRLFAQSRGVQSQGTNQPQNFNLPSDVPLVSKLAFLQMTPSEQQALLSYASSYGVTPEDYLAAIDSAAPQGNSAQSPLFGSNFRYARQ